MVNSAAASFATPVQLWRSHQPPARGIEPRMFRLTAGAMGFLADGQRMGEWADGGHLLRLRLTLNPKP